MARNRAIADALLISGDEDVRIGVQIAQSFGVRVHLLGIEAAKKSQSPLLMQEADTTSFWGKDEVAKFLAVKAHTVAPSSPKPVPRLDEIAEAWAKELDDEQIGSFAEYRKNSNGVPADLDGKLLAKARESIGRDLDQTEKRTLRGKFVDAVKSRKPNLFVR